MTKHFWIAVVIGLGLLSWSVAQTSKPELFDIKKSQQELEVMKGILGTTLSFVAQDMRAQASTRSETEIYAKARAWGGSTKFSNISAFYLYGQGAVFIIPVSNLRHLLHEGELKKAFKAAAADLGLEQKLLEEDLQLLDERLREEFEIERQLMEENLERERERLESYRQELELLRPGISLDPDIHGVGGGVPGGVFGGVGGGIPGGIPGGVFGGVQGGVPGFIMSSSGKLRVKPERAPVQVQAVPPASPAPRPSQASPRDPEALKKKVEEAQQKLLKRKEEVELRRKQFLEALTQIKVHLIEAIANHGDSLTHVRPNEYITLIITAGEGMYFQLDGGADRPGREIVSVQKSVISDYKAGKLSLDNFKQKVLQYSN